MILITGAAGLIGSTLARSLLLRGKQIIICDLFSSKEKWENVRDLKDAIFVHFDDLLYSLKFYKPKTIFHFAAYTTPAESNYAGFIKNNIGFSRFLLEYCLNNQVDFFYASSSATYGAGEKGFSDQLNISELKEITLNNPYAWSKQQFDFEVLSFIEKSKNRIVGYKFFNVFGENEHHKLITSSASVPFRFKQSILKNEDVFILIDPLKRYKQGHQERDFISVEKAIDLVQKVASKSSFNGLINIGSGNSVKFIDLFEKIKKDYPLSTSKVIFETMTEEYASQYQFYTCASLDNLKALEVVE